MTKPHWVNAVKMSHTCELFSAHVLFYYWSKAIPMWWMWNLLSPWLRAVSALIDEVSSQL